MFKMLFKRRSADSPTERFSDPIRPGHAVFVVDWFRSPVNGLETPVPNLRKMRAIVEPALRRLGWTTGVALPVEDGGTLDVRAMLGMLGLEPGREAWVKSACTDLPAEMDGLLEPLAAADLVVSFGMNQALRTWLDRRSIPFVDMEVSPLRFATGLSWRVRSSHPAITEALRAVAIDDEYYLSEAAHFRSALHWRGNFHVGDRERRYGVFFGQSELDLSLVVDGREAVLAEFEPRVREWFADVDEVLFRPHPYDPGGAGRRRVDSLQTLAMTDTALSTYRLLCAENVVRVAALSSSVLEESRYFGVPALRLVTPSSDGGLPIFNVANELASTGFWAAAMGQGTVRPGSLPQMPIRELIGLDWGYSGRFE